MNGPVGNIFQWNAATQSLNEATDVYATTVVAGNSVNVWAVNAASNGAVYMWY